MARPQVQHDGRVIGSLVAAAFHTMASSNASRREPCNGGPRLLAAEQTASAKGVNVPCGGMRAARRNKAEVPAATLRFTSPHLFQRTRKLTYSVLISIYLVNYSSTRCITEYSIAFHTSNKLFQRDINRLYCPIHASLQKETPTIATGTGVPLSHMWQYFQGTIVW